jgi:hypothetical protein
MDDDDYDCPSVPAENPEDLTDEEGIVDDLDWNDLIINTHAKTATTSLSLDAQLLSAIINLAFGLVKINPSGSIHDQWQKRQ